MFASTIPNRVTDDWAEAAPAAAITASAIRDFFMQVSPRLNIGLRCVWVFECRHARVPTGSPGQPPFGKLLLFHQTAFPRAKVLAGKATNRCGRTTRPPKPSGARATHPVAISHPKMRSGV